MLYLRNEGTIISLVYKNINSFITKCRNGCVRQRTAMNDTILGQRYTDPCLFHGRFDTWLFISMTAFRLTAEPDRLTNTGVENSVIIYFLTPTNNIFRCHTRDSFPPSPVYLKTQLQHHGLKCTTNMLLKVNM